jgi:acyl carrier protein
MNVEKEFYIILEDLLGVSVENIEITSTLKDLDIDSLDIVEIKLMCEEKFDLEIDNDEILDANNPTIETIIEKIEELINGREEERL